MISLFGRQTPNSVPERSFVARNAPLFRTPLRLGRAGQPSARTNGRSPRRPFYRTASPPQIRSPCAHRHIRRRHDAGENLHRRPRRRLQEAPQLPPGAAGHCFRGMNDAWSADENGPSDGASALDAAEAQPFALAEIARQPDRTTSAATPDALSALSRMRRWQENGAKRHPPIRDHLATAPPLLRAKNARQAPAPNPAEQKTDESGNLSPSCRMLEYERR